MGNFQAGVAMHIYDLRVLFSLADRASGLAGADALLDRDICLALRYLDGSLFRDWLAVLPDNRLSSADGACSAWPDALTASVDAVERLRRCLLPGSRLSIRSSGGRLEQFHCSIELGCGQAPADRTVTAESEACARLVALLRAFAGSLELGPDPGNEAAMLRFALVDK